MGRKSAALQSVGRDVALWEVRHRIPAGLEEHEGVLAIGNPASAETHGHPPAQRLDVQESLPQRFVQEKPTDCLT